MTHYIFDCDDVLLDWQGGFLKHLRTCGFNPDPAGRETWDMSQWLGTTPQYVRKLILDFNESPAFSKLELLPNARSTVWRLRDAGHTCGVLTACGDHFSVRTARFENLKEFNRPRAGGMNFAFSRLDCLPLGASKFDTLYAYTRNRADDFVFVEDNFAHAHAGVINGVKSYCIRKRHNRHDEAVHGLSAVQWIDDISEVV